MMQDNRNVFEIEQIDAPVSSAVFHGQYLFGYFFLRMAP